MTTSFIPPQTSPPPYIPFGTITTPLPKFSSVSETITISRLSISITLSIPNLTLAESTTTTTISPPTLNTYTTSKTTLKPFDTESHPSDSDVSTPTLITLTMPEGCAFLESTPSPPTPPHQPLINEHVFDIFMERLKNNEPSTPYSSEKTILISYDTDIHYEPNPNLEKLDDLVRQFESDVKVITIPYKISYLYSLQNFVQTNIHPTPLDELFT